MFFNVFFVTGLAEKSGEFSYQAMKGKVMLFFPYSLGEDSGNHTCGSWSRGLHYGHCNAYIFSH